MDAATKIPIARKVVPIQAHEVLSMRALVAQAQTNLAGHARSHKVVFDRGFWDGAARWWLDQHRTVFVVPAKNNMAGTVDAQAQAAAGEGVTSGVGCIPCGMGGLKPREPSAWRPRSWALPG
jgi:hypothetical protein